MLRVCARVVLLIVCLVLQGLLVAILYCFVNKEVGLMQPPLLH